MKFFKMIIICLVCIFSSMCSHTRETVSTTHNNITADSIYWKLSTINYASYKGQTIGYLLDHESINYNKFNFIDSEYRCLNFVNFSFGHNVFLEIYCPQNPQFIKMCDA